MAVAAAPAFAQGLDGSVGQRADRIGAQIADGVRHSDLLPNDAAPLRGELRQIVDLGRAGAQAREFNARLTALSLDLDYDLSVGLGPGVQCEGSCYTP